MLIGYVQAKQGDEDGLPAQRQALQDAGCEQLVEDAVSKGRGDQPELRAMLDRLREGDVVVAVLPNGLEALVAFLAAAGLGAVWSSCSPDFGARSLVDRFGQVAPTVLLGVDAYAYGGRRFETLDVPEGLFTPDAFFDLLPPYWRFQLQGPAAFQDQLRAIAQGPVTSRVLRVVPTDEGFFLEHEETQRTDRPETARRVWICRVQDARIAEVTCYCNGGWDDELRARHAAEAPMLRA